MKTSFEYGQEAYEQGIDTVADHREYMEDFKKREIKSAMAEIKKWKDGWAAAKVKGFKARLCAK